jgi:hypothetical protein
VQVLERKHLLNLLLEDISLLHGAPLAGHCHQSLCHKQRAVIAAHETNLNTFALA